MKHFTRILVLVMVVALLFGAKGSKKGRQPSQDDHEWASQEHRGKITAIEPPHFTLDEGDGTPLQIMTTGDTQFLSSGKKIKLTDLQVGQNVLISPAQAYGVARKVEVLVDEPSDNTHNGKRKPGT